MTTEDDRNQINRLRNALRLLEGEVVARDAEIARLRARIIMLLRCHYDEHEHHGSPTCFDIQSPTDEWETAALFQVRAGQYEPLRAMVDARNELAARVGQAEVENERLRAALEQLDDACDRNIGGLREGALSDARRNAKAALALRSTSPRPAR